MAARKLGVSDLPPLPTQKASTQESVQATDLGQWDLDEATLRAVDAEPDVPEDVEDFRLSDDLWWGTTAMRVRHHAMRLIAMARTLIQR